MGQLSLNEETTYPKLNPKFPLPPPFLVFYLSLPHHFNGKPAIDLISRAVPQTSQLATKSNQFYSLIPLASPLLPIPRTDSVHAFVHSCPACSNCSLTSRPIFVLPLLCSICHTLGPPYNRQSRICKSKKLHHSLTQPTTVHPMRPYNPMQQPCSIPLFTTL